MLEGRCRLAVDGQRPITLEAGDFVLLPATPGFTMSGFEPVRRWYGDDHVVDEAVLHATANGQPFGLEGRGRPVRTRFLHIFDFADGRISRESAWIDLAAIQQQLPD